MIKLLKRIIALSLSSLICFSFSCFSPAYATSTNDSLSDPILYLDFDEYISTQDYYTALAKQGYTLVVHIGEENESAEMDRIFSNNVFPTDTLQNANISRELTMPTYRYNVLTEGKKTISGKCTDTFGYLFTNYIYYGCTAYEVSLYNRGDDTLKVAFMREDDIIPFLSYEIPSKSTVIKYVTGSAWYGRFKNPCSVYGYVDRDI